MSHLPPLVNAVYYPSWRVYKDIPPSSLPLDKISTIFYAFAIPTDVGSLKFLDEYADAQIPVDAELGCLDALARVKRDNRHLRTLLSVGGGSGSAAFAALAASENGRNVFARAAREWVDRYSFDGIDIDWEHPKTPEQGRQYLQLLYACRAVLPSPRYLLTTALPVDPSVLSVIDIPALAAVVTHVNLMGYDFAGPWSSVAGHQAQLFASADEAAAVGWQPPLGWSGQTSAHQRHHPQLATSCQTGLRHLLTRGMPPNRILLGIPAYARIFPGTRQPGDRLEQQQEGGEEGAIEMDYRDVPAEWKTGAQVDRTRGAAWFVDNPGSGRSPRFVSMDVPETVRMKASFARRFGLGGIFFWTGAGDTTGEDSLVVAGFDGLHRW